MSSVDERIVEMRFENDQFEKGVDSSVKSLNKLKAGLNLDGAASSLNNLQTTAKGFDISHISDGVDKITDRFSIFGIMADQAIRRVTDGLIQLGSGVANYVESLTIDQIPVGFDKYERKIQSVQTIMNATGKSIDEVNGNLDKLNWYTDETSYSYSDMVDNIGKFTSSGVSLEEATTSMIGIANAAGYAGANVQDASHAMEGFSKAMGQGYMSRQNWQWIRTAHMDTVNFKEQMISAALDAHTLAAETKKVNGNLETTYYVANNAGKPIKNLAVSVEDFETNLAKGWLTKDVMNKALAEYGDFTEQIYEEYLRTGELTSDIIARLGEGADNLGLKAFRASQEAKTFSDAINSVKDAVSTGWMVSFEQIFGNYEEAKKLWTTVANELWDVFASGGEHRNEVLKEWHDNSGYQIMLSSIRNIWETTKAIGESIKGVFDEFFPPLTTKRLMDFTNKFHKFSKTLRDAFVVNDTKEFSKTLEDLYLNEIVKNNEKAIKNLNVFKDAFSGLFSIVKLGKSVFTSFKQILSPLSRVFAEAGKNIFNLAGEFGKYTANLVDNIINSETYSKVVNKLTGYVDNFATFLMKGSKFSKEFFKAFTKTEAFQNFLSKIKSGAQSIKNAFLPYLDKAKEKISGFFKTLAGIDKINVEEAVEKVIKWFNKLSTNITKIYGKVKSFLSPAFEVLMAIFNRLSPYIETAVNAVKKFWNNMIVGRQLGPYISQLFTEWKGKFEKLSDSAKTFIENFSFKDLWSSITKFFSPVIEKIDLWIDDVKKKLENLDLGKVAALGLVTATIPTIIAIGVAFGEAAKLLKSSKGLVTNLNDILNKFKASFKSRLMETAKAVTVFAAAIGILAGSLKLISTIDSAKLTESLKAFAILAGSLTAISVILGLLDKFKLLGDLKAVGLAMLEISASLAILSASLLLLDQTKPERIETNILALITMSILLMTIAGLLGKYIPSMSKGAVSMLAFSASIFILSEALTRMSTNLNPENMSSVLTAIVSLAAIMAAFSAMASNFKFGSGAGLIGAVASIFLLLKLFEKLSDDSIKTISEKAKDNIQFIIGTLVVIAGLAAFGRIGGKYAGKTGIAILEMSASILLIYEAIKRLGEMGTGVLTKGMVAVGLIMLLMKGLAKSTMYAGQNSGKAGLAIMAMASSLFIIYLAIKQIGKLNPEIMIKGLTGVVVALGMLGLALRSLRNLKGVKGAGGALLGMAVVIGTIAAALSYLSLFSWEDLGKGVAGIGATLLILATSLRIASRAKFDRSSLGGFIAGMIALAGVTAAIKVLANENWGSLKAAVQGISSVLLAISASMFLISHTKVDLKSGLGQIFELAAGIGAFWAIGQILSKLSEIDWSSFAPAMEGIINAFDHVMAAVEIMSLTAGVLSLFSPKAVGLAMLEMLGALLGIAAVFLAIGWINTIAGEGKIVEGAKTIGDAIGNFIGGIVGEGLESAASHLEAIGEYLTNFMEKAGGFFEGISALPSNIGDNILRLTWALQNFSKIGKDINKGKDVGLDTIGEQLGALSEGLATFSESSANIDLDNIKVAVEAGTQLNSLLNSLLPTGGLIQSIFGESEWNSLSDGLTEFGDAMAALSSHGTSGEGAIILSNIENAINAGSLLNNLLNSLAPTGGLIQSIFGESEWSSLSDGLSEFGDAMAALSSHGTSGEGAIILSNVENAIKAGSMLNDLLTNVLPEPGTLKKFFGDEGPKWSTISEGLSAFGLAMSSFSNVIAMGTFGEAFDARLTSISGIATLFGSLNSTLGDAAAVDSVNGAITSFGITLSQFDKKITNLKAENLGKAREFIAGITAIAGEFSSAGSELGEALKGALETSLSPETITGIGEQFISSFNNAFTDLSSVTAVGQALASELSSAVSGMSSDMEGIGGEFVSLFAGKISTEASLNARPAGIALASQTVSGASSVKGDMQAAGEMVGHGFAVGILNKISEAYNAGASLGGAATGGARTAVDVNSPSRVFIKIGESCGEGLAIGFNNSTSYVRTAAVKLAENSLNASAEVLKGFDNLDSLNIDSQPVITPVLDLSQVDTQAQRLNSMLNGSASISLSGRINGDRYGQNIDELIMVGSAILEEIRGGHDLYFDDGAFAGRINRRLGLKV